MVSPLWIASTDGDLPQVELILTEASVIDIEIKDEAGATALVQAVRNGHEHVVRALLGAGADPAVTSAHGELELLTTDPAILELVKAAKEKKNPLEVNTEPVLQQDGYSQEYPVDPSKAYYGQPNGSYMYYPPYPPTAIMPDGTPAPFYPPPPPSNTSSQPSDGSGGSNLPPPEIARFIPCRYFPACRYGPSCMFLHPTGPYFQGPMPPPAQYPAPYDPMAPSPYGAYFPVAQPPYAAGGVPPMPNGIPSSAPGPNHSPSAAPNHLRNASEGVSPAPAPFSPSGPPPPMSYTMSMPASYSQPGQGAIPPMAVNLPPLGQHNGMPPPNGNGNIYSPTSPIVQSAGPHRREPSLAGLPNGNGPHTAGVDGRHDGFMNGRARNGMGHARRESMRKGPQGMNGRRPACAFFPSGRCRNGNTCKFPHIMPDSSEAGNGDGHVGPKFSSRHRHSVHESADTLHEKMAGLDLRTDAPHVNGNGAMRPRHQNGFKANGVNGARYEKQGVNGRHSHLPQQRVPSADEFPVLSGSSTPPARSPGGIPVKGPTAAQVLQAPPPRRDSAPSTSRSPTLPPSAKSEQAPMDVAPKEMNVPNGHVVNGINGINGVAHDLKPLTFAAVATVAAAPPESASTVSVSA